MALADRTQASMESIESRRLLAFTGTGTDGVLVGANVTAVESAAARPDPTNFTHYATVLTGATGVVAQVTGADASGGAGSVNAINAPNNTTVSNTDVAANNPLANTYVVVWQTTSTTGGGGGGGGGGGAAVTTDVVNAQVFSNGVAVSGVIQVNQAGTGNATNSRVAMAGDGTFVVVWEGTQAGGQTQVFARRFSATGSPLAGQVQISAQTQAAGNNGVEPDVAANASGQYVITWVNDTDTLAETFNANGTATSPLITVAAQTFTEPAAGVFSTGGFIVAYAGTGGGGGAVTQIFAQRFNSSGSAVGGATTVSDAGLGPATVPELAVATNNSYVIGWAQAQTATPSVFAALAFDTFSSSGAEIGPLTAISSVNYGPDRRFGVAYRVPGHLDVVYAQGNEAIDRTYVDDGAGGGGGGGLPSTGDEIPVPGGALLIDRTASTVGEKITVNQTSTQIQVTVNNTTTNYTRSNYSSIYVRAGTGSDLITFDGDVTLPATVYGRDGSDIIYGGSGNDLIDGENGWDQIEGGAGNDTVLGGGGRNTLFGGSGDDLVSAGGADEGFGGGSVGQPNTTAGRNADSIDRQTLLLGENGNDTLVGNGGADDGFYGQAGNDSITGGDGADLIYGGLGNDTIEGGAGDDRIYGDRGTDFIEAGEGNDLISGGRDNDALFGNAGNDTIYGDSGADRILGGPNGSSLLGSTPGDIGYIDRTDTALSIEFVIRVR